MDTVLVTNLGVFFLQATKVTGTNRGHGMMQPLMVETRRRPRHDWILDGIIQGCTNLLSGPAACCRSAVIVVVVVIRWIVPLTRLLNMRYLCHGSPNYRCANPGPNRGQERPPPTHGVPHSRSDHWIQQNKQGRKHADQQGPFGDGPPRNWGDVVVKVRRGFLNKGSQWL